MKCQLLFAGLAVVIIIEGVLAFALAYIYSDAVAYGSGVLLTVSGAALLAYWIRRIAKTRKGTQ